MHNIPDRALLRATPGYVPVNTAVPELGISRKAIARMVRECGAPHKSLPSGRYHIDVTEFRAWLKQQPSTYCSKWRVRLRERKHKLSELPGVIYALVDPFTDQVRYIGKSCTSAKRYREHLSPRMRRRNPHRPVNKWIEKVVRGGGKPAFRVLQECLPGMIDPCEQEWIARGRAKGWKLLNVEDGGEGGEWSEEAKRAASERGRAKWQDPRYREHHRSAMVRLHGEAETRRRERHEQVIQRRATAKAERERLAARLRELKQEAGAEQERQRRNALAALYGPTLSRIDWCRPSTRPRRPPAAAAAKLKGIMARIANRPLDFALWEERSAILSRLYPLNRQ